MIDFDALLRVLDLEQDISDKVDSFVSEVDVTTLDDNNISYEKTQEGVLIKIFEQKSIYIYKTNSDFVENVEEKCFNKNILILESKKSYCPQSNNDLIFENVLYEFKFFHLMESKISLHWDNIQKEFILLSGKGKNIIKRQPRNIEMINIEHSIKNSFEDIEAKINQDSRFINFIRNNISLIIEAIQLEKQYFYILENLSLIYSNSIRDYELFQSKFNFKEFKTGLNEQKQEYIKDITNILHDFHSKIFSLPIQFGVYIFLILRFDKELFPLVITLIIIVIWSFFNIKNTFNIKVNIKYAGNYYLKNMSDLQETLKHDDIEEFKEEIKNRTSAIKTDIKHYLITMAMMSICMALINLYFVFCIVYHQ